MVAQVPETDDGRPLRLNITDPVALRSLTNRTRFLAVDEVYSTQRAVTATQLAKIAGVTASAMSYHLRELAQFGIVTRAEASEKDGRETAMGGGCPRLLAPGQPKH